MPSYDDQNFHVLAPESQETGDLSKSYVLKVMNSVDSQDADLIEAQTRAMMFLNEKGFPSPIPIPTTDGKIMSLESIDYGKESKTHMVRLLTYLPGIPLAQMPTGPQILYKAGRTLAEMNRVLAVSQRILPVEVHFTRLNHGDFSHTNILVQPVQSSADHSDPTHPQQALDISGILDFTDMNYGCSVCDVAISIMYLMLESSDPLSTGGHVLSGFESVTPLVPEERDAVFLLVLCRFSQSLVLARYNILLYPGNAEYLLTTARSGWKCLHQLWSLGKEAVEKIWYEAAKPHCT
ncbi:hypothetical protein scyTo_0020708 [Scyliorhinus torazame]|uniref:Hydroxylysine kinase n=1 Tax=Scyliorhinus torazame TaxID=75743 RepID=A0A401Q046_SCYTO|nr:hypothetical protein [Scyliorhinus torazame]